MFCYLLPTTLYYYQHFTYSWVAHLRTQYAQLQKNQSFPPPHPTGAAATLAAQHSTTTSELTANRLAVLDSIGFVWDLQQFDSDARWKRQYQELADYQKEHGNCNAPQSTPLGRYVLFLFCLYKDSVCC
jgi:Helicase associated domain